MATETKTARLSAGQLLPSFRLSAANRPAQLGPWDYKQHRNLVLIFFRSVECQSCAQLLRDIADHYGEYQQLEAEVLAISTDEIDHLRGVVRDMTLPFPVLSDGEGKVTEKYLEQIPQSAEGAIFHGAVFVADRWGAIFTRKIAQQDHDLAPEAEIREWLEFIELQCEECFPSEWPA
jgi:peroxiredoxin